MERFWGALDDGPPREALEAWKDNFAGTASGRCRSRRAARRHGARTHLIGHFIDWFFGSVPDCGSTDRADDRPGTLRSGTARKGNGHSTRKIYANTYCTHMRIRDGKAVLIREYFNPNVVLEAWARCHRQGHVSGVAAAGVGCLPVKLEPEFSYTAELAEPQIVGPGPYGLRQVLAVTGGKVTGNRFSGTAAPGGGDWLLAGDDGYGRLDVRAQFYTDDGAVIYMSYQGLVEVNEAAAGALGGGDSGTDFGDHYFVTTPDWNPETPDTPGSTRASSSDRDASNPAPSSNSRSSESSCER